MLHTLLYFLALSSLSTASIWARLSQMPVDILGFWRLTIAAVLLWTWVFLYHRQKLPRLEKRMLWMVASGFFFFVHLWTYKYAAKNTTIANTMVFFATNPIWTTLGAIIFFNERFTRRLTLAYTFAVAGVLVLLGSQFQLNSQINSVSLTGDFSAIASALLFSAYILTGKQARLYYSNSVYASFQYLTCAFGFFITAMFTDHAFMGYNDLSWVAVAGLVIFPTLLGHLSFSYLVKYMNLSLMSCGKLIEPILASIIAFFVFSERVQLVTIVAFCLTATGILILFFPLKKKNETTSESNL